MIPGVLCTGNIVMDVLARPVDEITWGGTRWVESITQALGGNGAATSATIAMLGVPARLIGAIGDDLLGTAALGRLNECGVDTRLIERLKSDTASSVALVRSDGTRAFLHQPGVGRLIFTDPIPLTRQNTAGCTRFHIGNPFSLPHLRGRVPGLLRDAAALGLSTSLDTAWDALGEWMKVLAPSLPQAGILFSNEDEARMLTGTADPPLAAARLREAGATNIVLKLGGNGCAVFTNEGEWHVPGYEVIAIDSTGAGDCFAGAYLAALQRNLPHPEAARVANAVGALNVQALGGTTGLLNWEQTAAWMATARQRAVVS